MGLIGDSKLLNPVFIKFFKIPILIIIYLAGVVWFLLLSHESLNAKTYFSENALLPGLVDSELYHDYSASQLSEELNSLLKKRKADSNYEIPSQWLLEKFKKNGLQAYVQNYTFSYPHGIYRELSDTMKGTNVYTIIRSPRSSSTEAIVINVPFNNHPSKSDPPTDTNHPAIALIIALAKAFKKKSYWAKDLVFVVSDNKEVGLYAWLSSYHHIPNQYIKAQMLPARSGVIQAALVLELQANTNGHFIIKTEGLNGKLPNLDLYNTVERLFNKEGGRTQLLEAQNTWLYQLKASRRWRSLVNMLSMVWHLASNYPTGNHGFFLSHGIEAVTIKGVEKRGSRQLELLDVARVVEGVMRSLNNLLERFHQSFFFYLLSTPSRYISIGVYMPPIGLMLLPLVIKVLSIKLEVAEEKEKKSVAEREEEERKKDEEARKKDGEGGEKDGEGGEKDGEGGEKDEEEGKSDYGAQKGDERGEGGVRKRFVAKGSEEATKEPLRRKNEEEAKKMERKTEKQEASEEHTEGPVVKETTSTFALILHASMALCLAVVFYSSTAFFIRSSRDFGVEAEDSLSECLLIAHLSSVVYPLVFKWCTRRSPLRVDARSLRILSLISVGVVCGPLSVVNVSLSFLVLLCWTPLALLTSINSTYRIVSLIKGLFALLLSPVCLLWAASAANLCIGGKGVPPSPLLALSDLGDGLMSSLLHYNLFNLWSYPLIYFVFFPVWSLLWFSVTVPSR